MVERDRLEKHRHRAVDHRPPRRRSAASRPRPRRAPGRPRTSPGMSRSTATPLSLWKWPPNPFWYASPAIRTTIGLAYAPAEKKRRRRRLAAELVLGVVQVGQVLDLRDRDQSGEPGAEPEAEDRLLVQDRVEHPGRSEPALQTAGDAVHPALGPDVLTEHQHPPVGGQDIGQRRVDRLGQRARLGRVRSRSRPGRSAGSCRGPDPLRSGRRGERRDHLGRRARAAGRRAAWPPRHGPRRRWPRNGPGRRAGEAPCADQHPGRGQQRIPVVVGLDRARACGS